MNVERFPESRSCLRCGYEFCENYFVISHTNLTKPMVFQQFLLHEAKNLYKTNGLFNNSGFMRPGNLTKAMVFKQFWLHEAKKQYKTIDCSTILASRDQQTLQNQWSSNNSGFLKPGSLTKPALMFCNLACSYRLPSPAT